MKILVINTGSSSIKYKLFDMYNEKELSFGLAEKIGEETSLLTHNTTAKDGKERKKVIEGLISDHREGLSRIVELLTDPEYGVIRDKSEITAVGHRVVHGGETFQAPTIITDQVIAEIKKYTPLAPLHNTSQPASC